MLGDLGTGAADCDRLGFPALAMMYARGPALRDPYDVDVVRHAARVGAELGADIVKTTYTGSAETFREVVRGCSVPVVVAGGPKLDSDRAVLEMVAGGLAAGAAGGAPRPRHLPPTKPQSKRPVGPPPGGWSGPRSRGIPPGG